AASAPGSARTSDGLVGVRVHADGRERQAAAVEEPAAFGEAADAAVAGGTSDAASTLAAVAEGLGSEGVAAETAPGRAAVAAVAARAARGPVGLEQRHGLAGGVRR